MAFGSKVPSLSLLNRVLGDWDSAKGYLKKDLQAIQKWARSLPQPPTHLTPRVTAIQSSPTPQINSDTTDEFIIAAQSTSILSMSSSLTGSPTNGQLLTVRIIDNGTPQSITWGAKFRGASLPTTTLSNTYLYAFFIWNSPSNTWDMVLSTNGSTFTIDASQIVSGIINPNRLGTGVSSTAFLRGDSTWQIPPVSATISKMDDISGSFNGSTTAFSIKVSGVATSPGAEQYMIVSINGVVQQPTSAYTVSGSTITFTTAPATGATFFAVILGALSINTFDAGSIVSGTINTARLGSGSASSSTYLRGDNTWATPASTVSISTTGNLNGAWMTLPTAPVVTLYMTNASLSTIQSIPAGYDGQILNIISQGAGQVDLAHNSGSGTTGQKLNNFATSGNTSLHAGLGTARLIFDATNTRWNLVHHEQGSWITRSFSAGNYTANAGTWTVASATRDAFYLKGRVLTFSTVVSGTTSSTPTNLKITLPNGYSIAGTDINPAYYSNNGSGGAEVGFCQSSGTFILFARIGVAAFGAGTVGVLGQLACEIT